MTSIENIPKVLDTTLSRLVNRSLDYTLKIVQNRINRVQDKFFTTMVSANTGIFGGSSRSFSLPTQEGISLMSPPKWPDLSYEYNNYRKPARYRNRFFINKGELKNTMRGLSADRIFGKPTVTYTQPGMGGSSSVYSSKPRGGYSQASTNGKGVKITNGKFQSNGQLGTISIDFFPKLKTGFKQAYGPQFYKEFFGQKQSGGKGGKPVFVGMKLDNHIAHRSFIGHYMEWWMKVKGKQALSKGSI